MGRLTGTSEVFLCCSALAITEGKQLIIQSSRVVRCFSVNCVAVDDINQYLAYRF